MTLTLLLLLGLCPAQAQAQNVMISEFRLSGPGGSSDEFIELYNNSNVTFDATGWSVGSATVRATIPANKVIPAYGRLLVAGSGYSLKDYGGPNQATGDVAIGDIPEGSPLELRAAAGNVIDAVNVSNLPAPLALSDEYSYVRRLDGAGGAPLDTGNDFNDFNLVDVASTAGPNNTTGVSSGLLRLGAPGPQNLASPTTANNFVTLTQANPASVRTNDGTTNTLALRRILTNPAGSGRTITGFRLRLVAATSGTNTIGVGDLRLISSSGNGTFLPMTLEAPATASPGGSGLNATVSLLGLPAGGLAPGSSVSYELLFNVVTEGSYRFLVNAEPIVTAYSAPSQPDLAVRLMADDEAPNLVFPESVWTGVGVFSGDGSNQTVSSATMIGLTRRFALRLTNAGEKNMAFRINLPDPPAGWTQRLFGAPSGGNEITLTDQNWNTPNLAPGANLQLRLEATPSATATADYSPVVAAWSSVVVDAVKVLCPLQKIAKLQWSRDGQSWQDVDSTPLSVDQYEVIAFRAVPTQSSISWDALPDFKPEWSSQGETHWGEVVWQHFPTAGTTTVMADCGNQAMVSVQVAEAS